ncbi:unnamed protein product [marine sediment metagenome]|uniref:Queuosine 5'-phosphate N-glycosylase/hydrolase n=1 Tax=marine sediment metagenome TaxID=412755 RepID=X1TT76_9ZZZZ
MNPVTESIDYVVEKSKHVRINRDKIREFTNSFNPNILKHWLDESLFNFSELNDKKKLNFLFVFNSISFSYWGDPKWSVEYKEKKHERGTWSMFAALERALQEGKPILNPDYI